jgi:hypothetical protein
VIGATTLEMAAGREAAGPTTDGAETATEPTAWTAPLGSGVATAGEATEADRPAVDVAKVAGEPAAWSVPLGLTAAGSVAEAAPDGTEAGSAAPLTGLGVDAVAAWVAAEPTAWTVEPAAWARPDGAAAGASGAEPVALEPDVAGATRVEPPVDVELADGVAEPAERTGAAADVTGWAGVELPCVGALWDRLDDTEADGDAAGSEVGVEAGVEVEPLAELEWLAGLEPPAEPELPAGAVDWAGVDWAEDAEAPCELDDPTGLAWDDAPWVTAEATEPTVCRALAGPEAPVAEDGDDGVVSAWACWWEKSTRMIRIPAASNPACTARRAMPRRTAWATRVLPTVGVASKELPIHHACPFMREELDLFDIEGKAGSHGAINQGITTWPAETQMISTRAAGTVTVFRLLMRSFWDW